jgi:molybdenum cofactor cytidylyltransferase
MGQVCSRIIIVGGYQFEDLQDIIKLSSDIKLIYNEGFSRGMFSSILKGIGQVREKRFFLCPGDYPLIKEQTYKDLLSKEGEIIIPTYRNRSGHPVLIASSQIQNIMTGGYSCLRDFIKVNDPNYIEVLDPGIHMDIDTMQDYENMVQHFSVLKAD